MLAVPTEGKTRGERKKGEAARGSWPSPGKQLASWEHSCPLELVTPLLQAEGPFVLTFLQGWGWLGSLGRQLLAENGGCRLDSPPALLPLLLYSSSASPQRPPRSRYAVGSQLNSCLPPPWDPHSHRSSLLKRIPRSRAEVDRSSRMQWFGC